MLISSYGCLYERLDLFRNTLSIILEIAYCIEDIPAGEHEIVTVGQRYGVLDLRGTPLGAFAQTNRSHLRQRPDRLRKPLAHGNRAGDGRGADCSQTNEEHAELAACSCYFKWWSHNLAS